MSGNISGVQKRVKEIAPYAVYIHCYAHTLNLALTVLREIKMLGTFSAYLSLCMYSYPQPRLKSSSWKSRENCTQRGSFINYSDSLTHAGHVDRVL